jgi:hypothetical protein
MATRSAHLHVICALLASGLGCRAGEQAPAATATPPPKQGADPRPPPPPATRPATSAGDRPPLDPGITAESQKRPEPRTATLSSRSRPEVEPSPSDKPPDRAPAMRAGALRLPRALRAKYEIEFAPLTGLTLPLLDRARAGRKIGAEVKPFAQRPAGGDEQDVERGGEIVAIALAQQLEKLGWTVNVLDRAQLRRGLRIPQASLDGASLALRVEGSVLFALSERGARIDGEVRFLAGRSVVVARSSRSAPLGSAPGRSARLRAAAEGALRAFVQAIVSDAALDRDLAKLLR